MALPCNALRTTAHHNTITSRQSRQARWLPKPEQKISKKISSLNHRLAATALSVELLQMLAWIACHLPLAQALPSSTLDVVVVVGGGGEMSL